MKRIIGAGVVFFSWSLLSLTLASAAPSISGVQGSFVRNQSVTVTGSLFSTKSKASPIRYDNFEGGTPDTTLPSESAGGYSLSGSPQPRFSTEKIRYAGTQSAIQNFTSHYSQYMQLTTTTLGTSLKTMYFSGWFNMTTGGAPSRNVKILNMGAGNGWQTRVDVYPNNGSGHLYTNQGCDGTKGYVQDWSTSTAKTLKDDGQWHRIDGWLDIGSANTSNGYRDVNMDHVRIGQVSGIFIDGSCSLTYLLFGHYFARDTGSPTPWGKRFWDEIYVDSTRARVELCNSSTWAGRSHCEIQIPTTWSTSQITVKINTGTFTTGQTVYLYVVDAGGQANSSGYPVVIGGGSVPASIAPPAGFQLQ